MVILKVNVFIDIVVLWIDINRVFEIIVWCWDLCELVVVNGATGGMILCGFLIIGGCNAIFFDGDVCTLIINVCIDGINVIGCFMVFGDNERLVYIVVLCIWSF